MKTKALKPQGNSVIVFLRQVREEMDQVTWPTKDKTVRLTVIVIGVSLLVGLYLGALDFLFTNLMGVII